jgi:colanic acid biosynthesis glycosyl transferase WcaI
VTKSIGIIAVNYYPEVTACAPYTTDIAEELVKQGHEVTVLAAMPHYPAWKVFDEYAGKKSFIEVINGVNVIRVKSYIPRRMNALTRGLFELDFLIKGLWQVRTKRFDSVLSVSPNWSDIAIGVFLKRKGATLKVLVQDLMAAAASQSGIKGGALVAGIVERLEGWALRNADSVGVITEQFRERVLAFGVSEEKIVVTPNYSQSHIVPMDRNECREFWGWPKDDLIVMHTGNMGLKQDLGNVIEAARIAKISNPNMKFYLVGDGSQKESLVKQASGLDNVIFKDLVSNDHYSRLLGAADVLLINESPNQVDMSLPSKLTSYVAAHRPIISTCNEGSGTALAAKTHGPIVPPQSPSKLVSALSLSSYFECDSEIEAGRNMRESWVIS